MTTLSGATGANGRWCADTMPPPGWNRSSGTQTPIVCSIGSVSIAAGQQTGPACVQIFP